MKLTHTLLSFSVLAAITLTGCGETAQPESEKVTSSEQVAPKVEAPVQNQLKEVTESPVSPVQELDLGTQIANTKSRIMTLLEDNQCDNDTQCKVIGLGNRPCGGFDSFEPVSTLNKQFDEAHTLARELYDLSRQHNANNQMMGICQHLPTPAAACSANKCELVENNTASSEY